MGEWWNVTIVIAAGLLTVFNLIDKISGAIKEQKAPTNNLELRVTTLEKTVEFEYRGILATYEQRFGNDLKRLDRLEESDKMTKRALLALIRNAESGNNKEELNSVAEDLNNYVWGSKK